VSANAAVLEILHPLNKQRALAATCGGGHQHHARSCLRIEQPSIESAKLFVAATKGDRAGLRDKIFVY
jgi:hypothetical protein